MLLNEKIDSHRSPSNPERTTSRFASTDGGDEAGRLGLQSGGRPPLLGRLALLLSAVALGAVALMAFVALTGGDGHNRTVDGDDEVAMLAGVEAESPLVVPSAEPDQSEEPSRSSAGEIGVQQSRSQRVAAQAPVDSVPVENGSDDPAPVVRESDGPAPVEQETVDSIPAELKPVTDRIAALLIKQDPSLTEVRFSSTMVEAIGHFEPIDPAAILVSECMSDRCWIWFYGDRLESAFAVERQGSVLTLVSALGD